MAERKQVHVGVFVPSSAQLLDLACVDIFAISSHEYLSGLGILPAAVVDLAPSIKIHYVSAVQPGETTPLTAGLSIVVTDHYSSPDVAPGRLDVVLVPGPDPNERWERGVLDWLKSQDDSEGTDVLSVCTGIYLCGAAGLLKKGRKAAGPRALQDDIKKRFGEDLDLVGHELRWVQDRNFWSSGELCPSCLRNCRKALFLRRGPKEQKELHITYTETHRRRHQWQRPRSCLSAHRLVPAPIVSLATEMADVGDRPQRYGQGKSAFALKMCWMAMRAWLIGFGRYIS